MEEDVIFCLECQEKLIRKAKGFPNFCSECGTRTPLLRCPKCKAERAIKQGVVAKYCHECGYGFPPGNVTLYSPTYI